VAPFRLEHGYVVADVPELGRLLIDSGAGPCVTSEGQDIELLGGVYHTTGNFAGVTLHELRQHVGPIDVLLGQQVLKELYVYFDNEGQIARFSKSPPVLTGPCQVIPLLDGIVPQVVAEIDDKHLRFLLDTGAPNAIIDSQHLNGFPKVGEVDDFFPTYGAFRMPVFEIPTKLGNISIPDHRFSVLPDALRLHQLCGADGILGLSHVLQQGNVLLALPENKLIVEKTAGTDHVTEGVGPHA
jgi:hypothetical protein